MPEGMAPLLEVEAIRQRREQGAEVESRSGAAGAIGAAALFLAVLAIAALGEVVGERSASTAEAPRASSWAAVLRIADDARVRGDVQTARRAYLTALFRARGERALVGVLGAAEGFKALGDREAVEHALRIAASLGTPAAGADTDRRLQALRDRTDATDALPTTVQPLP
jgi:hypothetical protein